MANRIRSEDKGYMKTDTKQVRCGAWNELHWNIFESSIEFL